MLDEVGAPDSLSTVMVVLSSWTISMSMVASRWVRRILMGHAARHYSMISALGQQMRIADRNREEFVGLLSRARGSVRYFTQGDESITNKTQIR
jgi:hypothetical protein